MLDLCMNATRMDFRDEAFDISIDKGTYDALAVSYNNLKKSNSVDLRASQFFKN